MTLPNAFDYPRIDSRVWFLFILLFLTLSGFGQPGQIDIARINQMPHKPFPYRMRNWKEVAVRYDQFIFSNSAVGPHLPLLTIKPVGINYQDVSPILMQSYVGSNSSGQAEAVNIMPAIVGASLMNINKSIQNGTNWVAKTKDFFNKKNGENVYLNGYSTQSGGDWWYDVMPNIFFYQLYALYPDQTDFQTQFKSVADQWLAAVHAMGGNTTPWSAPQMSYRGWRLASMTGSSGGVKQPEAAGSIGWLLYHAYKVTNERKYLHGAQMCLEFLNAQTSNPSYELQLPYGVLIAAKMNAELGASYDIEKMLNWTFERGSLRGWGSVAGRWAGADVHGLIGEANDAGNDYAFMMNGFQQAAALVPLMKYDKRFARSIAKWILNVANASRFFYPRFLPSGSQDDHIWSSAHDPKSVIGYEALRERNPGNNIPLYGTGDAKRNGWAATNLSLYSSSSVGYLAAIIDTTNVEGILKLDLNKTDFFSKDHFPSFALYNPYATIQQVTFDIPQGSFDVYDALNEQIVLTSVGGTIQVAIKPHEALILVCKPSGAPSFEQNGRLLASDKIMDYRFGYRFNALPRIKALTAKEAVVSYHQNVPIYLTTENISQTPTYNWYLNKNLIATNSSPAFTWTAPAVSGKNVVGVEVQTGSVKLYDSIMFDVVEYIPAPPEIKAISSDSGWYLTGSRAILTCDAVDQRDSADKLSYEWTVSAGTILSKTGKAMTWQMPATEGVFEASCTVTDTDKLTVTGKKIILVKTTDTDLSQPMVYYPFDGDTKDYSGNRYDASSFGVEQSYDARGEFGKAYLFRSGSDIINCANSADLNFQDKITVSFWFNVTQVPEEAFIISHGSWEERWKASITPAMRLRWTVKTSDGIKDIDSSQPIITNKFYHATVVYSGYSMELYLDGQLDHFIKHAGNINTTNKSLTVGRKDEGTTRYSFAGTVDEVRVYRKALSPVEIQKLQNLWNNVTSIERQPDHIDIYPNPITQQLIVVGGVAPGEIEQIQIFHANGVPAGFTQYQSDGVLSIHLSKTPQGLLIMRIHTKNGIFNKMLVVH